MQKSTLRPIKEETGSDCARSVGDTDVDDIILYYISYEVPTTTLRMLPLWYSRDIITFDASYPLFSQEQAGFLCRVVCGVM